MAHVEANQKLKTELVEPERTGFITADEKHPSEIVGDGVSLHDNYRSMLLSWTCHDFPIST